MKFGYYFVYRRNPDNPYDLVDVTMHVPESDISLPDLLKVVEGFLQACGFVIDGELEMTTSSENSSVQEDEE